MDRILRESAAPINLIAAAVDGSPLDVVVTGDLTLRGTTKTVSFPVDARFDNSTIQVAGSIEVLFADWGIANPSNAVATTRDKGLLEFLLVFTRCFLQSIVEYDPTHMRRGIAVASVLTSVILTVGLWSSVSLAAKGGGKCQNAGAVVVTDSITYNCVKVDKKLKWVANPHQTWMSDVVAIVNKLRSDSGLNSLSECVALNQSAQLHSQDMNTRDFFDHTNPDGKSPSDRIRLTGYFGKAKSLWTGENIAAGFADAASVMAAWMKSPGHRANILNAKFTQLGVGIATTRSDSKYSGYVWTQNFGAGGTC